MKLRVVVSVKKIYRNLWLYLLSVECSISDKYRALLALLLSTKVYFTIPNYSEPEKSELDNKGTLQIRRYWKKREDILMKYLNEDMKQQLMYLKKELNTIKYRIQKNSTNLIIFDKDGNKVPQTETGNDVN